MMVKYNKLTYIIICNIVLLFFTIGIVFAKEYPNEWQFISFRHWECFKPVTIPFSKVDSSREDVVVNCFCSLMTPSYRRYRCIDKINCILTNSQFQCWENYINKYGGTLNYLRFEINEYGRRGKPINKVLRSSNKRAICKRVLDKQLELYKELKNKKNGH